MDYADEVAALQKRVEARERAESRMVLQDLKEDLEEARRILRDLQEAERLAHRTEAYEEVLRDVREIVRGMWLSRLKRVGDGGFHRVVTRIDEVLDLP